tara:strand:- start:6 stop:815 length:810 start_codon:yes stop_codon:yes gene_type:complete
MSNLNMYCICIHNNLLDKVKKLNYIPVGLGDDNFHHEWIRDNSKDNISNKNKYYGEYSFHYWFWKNEMHKINNNKWTGFCAYRRFWLNSNFDDKEIGFSDKILKNIPKKWEKYDVILGDQIRINEIPWIKILKYGKISLLKSPKAMFKNGRTIKFHFDMFHGNGVLDKAIDQLHENDREDFRNYVNTRTTYNQGNMFICKSKEIINNYYKAIFDWLNKCEKVFGFKLHGYGKVRIYAFLAERFLPFWFTKYTNYLELPVIFRDLREENL